MIQSTANCILESVRVDQPKAVQNSCLNLEENKASNMLGPNGTPTPSDHFQVLSEKPEIPCNFPQTQKMVFHHLESARQKGKDDLYFGYSPSGRIRLYLSTLSCKNPPILYFNSILFAPV